MSLSFRSLLKAAGQRSVPDRFKELLFRFSITLMDDGQRDEVRRRYEIASMESSLRALRRSGFVPRSIVDVGAYSGAWTRMAKKIWPDAFVLMVEVQNDKEPLLRRVCDEFRGTVDYEAALLGPEERAAVPFYEMETGSSVLEEQSVVPRHESTHRMRRLDGAVAGRLPGPVDFVKLDVQGYELEVLRGAPNALSKAEAVLMEVSLIPVNRGAPVLLDVLTFMDERGFAAYDFCSFIRRPLDHALWQTDVIFVSRRSPLLASSRLDAP